jgi:putative oxidoreductase
MNSNRQACGLALIRAIVGVVFLMHGGQKLFVMGIGNVANFFGTLGIPMPGVAAPVVTFVEFLGGLALLLGLLTRWAALFIAIEMLVAILKVHLAGGFFLPKGFEFPLTLMTVCIGLFLAGGGAPAVDNYLGKKNS